MLQAAASSPYPSGTPPSTGRPLRFELEVVEHPPTSDQLQTILSYLSSSPKPKSPTDDSSPTSISSFLSSHPSSPALPERPHTAHGLSKLATQNPNAIKWPIVVDWTGGRVAVGKVEGEGGVEGILEAIRRKRDGEDKGEEIDKPKGWFS